ncbi:MULTISPECIES: RES family NAD+ phosphorylase [Vreelandella]|uniref:RES domain-containing protein n=1 Tax=Vreelandella titanicae TaxID=664683 RepID=A0A558J116_9GAMM|nr:RES family NAD+ phosphorylase [Halomonas titanicae]TVU87351.1 RES domain-containing protein [Halomonas titanicae]
MVSGQQGKGAPAGNAGVPLPWDDLDLLMFTLTADEIIQRIHLNKYGSSQFNGDDRGNARFSPIYDANGSIIPTMYAGITKECAMMETIYHDVPFAPGLKTLDKSRLRDKNLSTLQVQTDLLLVDLSSVGLRKLGLQKSQLIETEKDRYPDTRQWAEAIHKQTGEEVKGLSWISKQDDSARAYLFFGDRVSSVTFTCTGSHDLTKHEPTYESALALADLIGVNIIDGLT